MYVCRMILSSIGIVLFALWLIYDAPRYNNFYQTWVRPHWPIVIVVAVMVSLIFTAMILLLQPYFPKIEWEINTLLNYITES
jgi:hypothetical protein